MHDDHKSYFILASKSRLDKAIQNLIGEIEGIVIDAKINAKEFTTLKTWIEQYSSLRLKHPFNELIPVIEEAIKDGILTGEEKQDILWLCEKLSSKGEFYDRVTHDMQRLHGVLGGILADIKINEGELKGLSAWIADHEHLKTCWPYDETDSIVTSVMEDGKIDAKEHVELLKSFAEYVQIADDKTITDPPLLKDQKITGLCAMCPEIKFEDSLFCFTGASTKYKRSELAAIVKRLGGKYSDIVTTALNYLVIGADGNPCWAYACYGRKVESVVKLRKQGHKVLIVHENDFHDAVAEIQA